jgi:hypothetical protein
MDLPLDAWYAWLGLAAASATLLGIAGALPTQPPPDAAGVADTVDRVAVGGATATAEHPLAARAVRVGPRRLGLRNGAGAAHATFAFGPVTPVPGNGRLSAVLGGTPPDRAFDSPAAFRRTARRARDRDPTWSPAPDALRVRRVTWEGVDVTLVGA